MREKILEAAMRVYTSKPPQEVTVADIAKEAGISSGLVFYYFRNKEGLEKELAMYIMSRLIGAEHNDLTSFVKDSLRQAEERPGLFRFLQYVLEKDKQTGGELARHFYERGVEKLSELLRRMSVEDPDDLAVLIMALIDGLALYSYLLGIGVSKYAELFNKLVSCLR